MSLLDLNADLNLALDVASPIDLGVAANANVAAPINGAVGANILSVGSADAAVAHQGVNIDQDLSGSAIAHAPQHSSIDQAAPAAGTTAPATDAGARTGPQPPADADVRPERQPARHQRPRSRGRQARRAHRRRGRRERQRRGTDRRLGLRQRGLCRLGGDSIADQQGSITQHLTGPPRRLPTRPPRSSSNGPHESHVSGRQGAGAGHLDRTPRPVVRRREPRRRCPPTGTTTGIELLGALTGSGYRNPPSLVRRPDGQTVQLTPLLYLVLEAIDGERNYGDVAEAVSTAYGRRLAPDDVRQLTEAQLRPLGLVRGPDGSEPQLTKANPLLALRFRWIVSDPEVTRRITAPFAALFAPLVVVIVVLAFALISGWVLFTKGLGSATHQAFDQPILLVVVFAITIFSAGFHEFGHASACRYGGATPGAMGTGLYLVWPAFYTDVTDSYRLGRAGRLRVDLGGLYFNALVTVAMFVVWLVTGWDALLLILAAQLLQMVRQLAPMVRFDGYHVLADLTGVPDLASRIGPTLRGLVPGREPEARAAELKRWARVVVTTWVLVIVPLLLVTLVLMVVALPRVVGTAWSSVLKQEHALTLDWAGGDLVGVAIRVLSIVAVSLPVLGSLFVLARLVKTVTTSLWTRTAGRPGRRALAALLVVAVAAALTWAWWPDANRYRPVQSFEKGTLVEGLSPASFVGGSARLQDGQIREGQRSVWASTTAPPTKDHPQLALVLVPRSTSSASADGAAPAWVFPFNRPGAPGAGTTRPWPSTPRTDRRPTTSRSRSSGPTAPASPTATRPTPSPAVGSARPLPWPSRSSS